MAEVELVTGGRAAARRGTFTRDRLVFGYALLAPAVLYMCLLVGVPFFFSLYLSLSDATVGSQVARFVGLQNFVAIFQDSTFRLALLEKDIGIAAAMARDNRVPAPVTQLTADVFRIARGELGEIADHVEIVKLVEQWAGVEIA